MTTEGPSDVSVWRSFLWDCPVSPEEKSVIGWRNMLVAFYEQDREVPEASIVQWIAYIIYQLLA